MQITKLSFLSTQSLGDSVFAVEEVVDIPIDQVFGTHRAREKALINLIGSDGVQKVSRDTWKIVKDITLEAANATMRKGDYFRVKLDEEGDDSPIHFDLDATGVFVLSREVFASLQTYAVLEPGKEQAIRMQFTFGGKPVVDAVLTSAFSSLNLVPVDATNGVYELRFFTAMAPSDDILNIEVTGVSLRNSVYEAPVHITVREPVLSIVPVDLELHAEQTKDITWQLLMEGKPAPVSTSLGATANPQSVGGVKTDLIAKIGAFKLIDSANAIYSLNVTATDEVGAESTIDTTYRFSSNFIGEIPVPIKLLSKESLYITHSIDVLEANQTQLIPITLKLGATAQRPVTDAKAVQIVITGACIQSVESELVPVDPAKGVYAYRVTTNHKGGPISIRSVLSTSGNPYPDFYNLTAKGTKVIARALNTLPAADTADLTFRVTQDRLGGTTNLVGAIARTFTVGGGAIARVNGSVEAVGLGVYKVSVTTNNVGGSVPVTATLTIEGVDVDVSFSTSAARLSDAVLTPTGPALTGETVQNVPLNIKLDGADFDVTNATVRLSGSSYVANGIVRRTGKGTYEIVDVDVNGKGGVLNISLTALVKGYSQTMLTTVPVNPISNVLASNVTHLRPTTTDNIQFNLTRDGLVLTGIKLGKATITGGQVVSYDGTTTAIDANTGRYQIKSVTAGAPATQEYFQISLPVVIKGYSYTVIFNSYTEAMPNFNVGGGSSSNPGAGQTVPGGGGPVVPGLVGGNLAGGLTQDYCMYFEVDGKPANITSGTVTASGVVLASGPDAQLAIKGPGTACITGLSTTTDGGYLTIKGSMVIDGITYPLNFVIRNAPAAPTISNVTVLECESIQTLYFTMKQGVTPVPDAVLSNVAVTGDAIESFSDFGLVDADTGRYRVNVITNDKGGNVHITLGATFVGMLYPVSFDTTAKDLSTVGDGSGWKMVATAPTAATISPQSFSFTRGGDPVKNPSVKDVTVTGVSVLSSTDNAEKMSETTFRVTSVSLDSRGGAVKLKASASVNGVTWHPMEQSFTLAQASAPVVTGQTKMLVARQEATLQFSLTRNGRPVKANTITNIRVSGTPVASAKQDLIVVNAAAGQYGTTVTPNDLGGNIDVIFDLNEGGVDYPNLTFTGTADIYHPWKATMLNGPVPERLTAIDFSSHLDDGTPVAITSGTAVITGSCRVSPTAETTLVYQDATNKTYRIPNVMVNNTGGNIHVVLKVIYEGAEIIQEFDFTVKALPVLQAAATGADLPFQTTSDLTFTVDRGPSNPSVFNNSMVKNLTVTGAAVAGYTPTIIQVSPGNFKLSVQTNGKGGNINVGFTVTLAGIDYPLSFTKLAVVEPPVTAVSTNTLVTNTSATNMDFTLMRGTVPCADAFVVQSIAMNSKSVSSYSQSIINVNVALGQYRIQVTTSAYSDPIPVTIVGTVRGEPVTLTFTAQIQAGVLPTVTLLTSSLFRGQASNVNLSFKNGTTDINGAVTLDSVDGPLTNPTLNSNGVITGIPTVAGAIDLTINFTWKGASYSSTVTGIPVTEVYPATLTSTSKLTVGKLNTTTFTMNGADGNVYPASGFTFAITGSPFAMSQALARQSDGSFSVGFTPSSERLSTTLTIVVTETATKIVRYHTIMLEALLSLEARFVGTTPLDSSSLTNQVVFDVYNTVTNAVQGIYTKVDMDSLKVVGRGSVNNITGWSSFTVPGSPTSARGSFYVSANQVDIVDADYTFDWNSGLRVYKIPGSFRLQKPMTATWTDIAGAQGSVKKTLKVKLLSGSTPVVDALDSGTTVTNATINQNLYLIDAATGTYGIDVTPNGAATSMVVTLKVKQAVMPTVINTFTAQTVTVAPAPITAVANNVLGRQTQNTGVLMEVLISQGTVPITNAVINSYSITGPAVESVYSGPTNAGSGLYRWAVRTRFDGAANPQVMINATINGVGYVFNIDFPIVPVQVLALSVVSSDPLAKNISGKVTLNATRDGATLGFANSIGGGGGVGVQFGTNIMGASSNYSMKSAVINPQSGNYIDFVAVPLTSGTATWTVRLVLYGATYDLPLTVTVADAGTITVVGGVPMYAEKANTLIFNMTPPAGVTYDGTETLTVTTKPTQWVITTPPVRNPDGTYSMVVTPNAESNDVFTVTAAKGGTNYRNGCPTNVENRYELRFAPSGVNSETTVGLISAPCNLVTKLGNTPGGFDMQSATLVDRASIKVYAAAGVINPAGAAPDALYGNNSASFRATVLQNDYATMHWSIIITSRNTGFVYTVYSDEINIHDNANLTMITTGALEFGRTLDIKFKLTYAVSGRPVTNAVQASSPSVGSGLSNLSSLKVIDAANGIYAVTATVTATSGNVLFTPRWSWPLSKTIYTGAQQTFATVRAVTATVPAIGATTRNIYFLMVDGNGPIKDATITAISAGTYVDAAAGSFTAYDATKGVYKVPMTVSKPMANGQPNDNVNVTYHRTGGEDITVPVALVVQSPGVKVSVDGQGWPSTGGVVPVTPVNNWLNASFTTFAAPRLQTLDGVDLGPIGGNVQNDYANTNKLIYNPSAFFSPQKDVTLKGGTVTASGTTYYVWSDPFDVYRVPYAVITPTTINLRATVPGNSIPAQTLPSFEVTFKDDLGNPLSNVTLTGINSNNNNTNFYPVGTGASWASAMVPKTDGSDGVYVISMRTDGYAFSYQASYSATFGVDIPGLATKSVTAGIKLNY